MMDSLRDIPLLTGADFADVFGKLAKLACLEHRGATWEVRTFLGTWTGASLDSLGGELSFESLMEATAGNAARLRRWRDIIRGCAGGSDSHDETASPKRIGASTALVGSPPEKAASNRPCAPEPHASELRHHQRALGADDIAERRRKFPELFGDLALSSPKNLAAPGTLLERRRRFPELDIDQVDADYPQDREEPGIR